VLIWGVGLLAFALLAIGVILLTFFLPPQRYEGFTKWASRTLLRMIGIRVRVEGRENIDPAKTYLFISNHVNIFDPFIFSGYVPVVIRGVEVDRHFRWPLYGFLIRRMGHVPISRVNARSALESLRRATGLLRNGISLVMFPEGTRTLDGRLQPFKTGPFHLAKMAQIELAPVAMIGSFEIQHKGSKLIRPGTVTFRFGEVIPYEHFKHMDVRQLRDVARDRIAHLLCAREDQTQRPQFSQNSSRIG